jgi:hypothetical protein
LWVVVARKYKVLSFRFFFSRDKLLGLLKEQCKIYLL